MASNARVALVRLVHTTIVATETTVCLHYSLEKYRCNCVRTDDNELDIVARINSSRKRAGSFQWEGYCKLAIDRTLWIILSTASGIAGLI